MTLLKYLMFHARENPRISKFFYTATIKFQIKVNMFLNFEKFNMSRSLSIIGIVDNSWLKWWTLFYVFGELLHGRINQLENKFQMSAGFSKNI